MISAIYFDLDNTLVDRTASIDQFSRAFLKLYRGQLDCVSAARISDIIQSQDNGGYLPDTSPYRKIYEAIGAELHRQLPWYRAPSAADITHVWRTQFPKHTVAMSGAEALLSRLQAQGYHLGIIFNGKDKSRQYTLRATPFAGRFKQVVSSEAFGVRKPDVRISVETVRAAGFSPTACCYVGDHPINDATGAINAGMKAVLLSGYHPELPVPKAATVIHHLSEVLAVI